MSNETRQRTYRDNKPVRLDADVSREFHRAVKAYAALRGTTISKLIVQSLNSLLENDR